MNKSQGQYSTRLSNITPKGSNDWVQSCVAITYTKPISQQNTWLLLNAPPTEAEKVAAHCTNDKSAERLLQIALRKPHWQNHAALSTIGKIGVWLLGPVLKMDKLWAKTWEGSFQGRPLYKERRGDRHLTPVLNQHFASILTGVDDECPVHTLDYSNTGGNSNSGTYWKLETPTACYANKIKFTKLI